MDWPNCVFFSPLPQTQLFAGGDPRMYAAAVSQAIRRLKRKGRRLSTLIKRWHITEPGRVLRDSRARNGCLKRRRRRCASCGPAAGRV